MIPCFFTCILSIFLLVFLSVNCLCLDYMNHTHAHTDISYYPVSFVFPLVICLFFVLYLQKLLQSPFSLFLTKVEGKGMKKRIKVYIKLKQLTTKQYAILSLSLLKPNNLSFLFVSCDTSFNLQNLAVIIILLNHAVYSTSGDNSFEVNN